MVHISGEPGRAYIHVCTCRRGRPGGFPGNAGSAESAESAGFFAISGWVVRGASALPRGIVNDSLGGWAIFPPFQLGALSNGKGTYFRRTPVGVRPCLHMSPRAPEVFPENAESAESAESSAIVGIYEMFGEIIRAFLGLYRVVFTDPTIPPVGRIISPIIQIGALSNEKGTYSWRITAGVHPCLHMSPMATGGFAENAESSKSSGIFAICGGTLSGTDAISEGSIRAPS